MQKLVQKTMSILGAVSLTTLALGFSANLYAQQSVAAKIEAAMYAEHRSADNQARNRYRHPVGTLSAMQLNENMTVMEIWPGGGWYTEILAPVLRDSGKLVVASYDPSIPDQPEYRYRLHQQLQGKFAANPGVYDQVETLAYSNPKTQGLGENASVDLLLTFRNMHGWVGDGLIDAILADFKAAIKPGGHLGIVQHRASEGSDPAKTVESGYLPESAIIEMVEAAGFEHVVSSEVNANPKDTKDYSEGVWTLPPSYTLGDKDKAKYQAIGESDRMTLLFKRGS